MSPATVPPIIGLPQMTYDSVRQVAFLFGIPSLQPLPPSAEDPWKWDGTDWISPATPSPSDEGYSCNIVPKAYIFDLWRSVSLGFGGDNCGDPSSCYMGPEGLCKWDGMNWSGTSNAVEPQARVSAMMAFDSDRGVAVLFGGFTGPVDSTTYFGDTWERNGTAWNRRYPISAPAGRTAGGMVYDAARGFSVLFGGDNETQLFNDTWTWSGAGPDTATSASAQTDGG